MTCQLCGQAGAVVRVVRWTDGSFEAIACCPDRDACYRRLASRGEPWPLSGNPLLAVGGRP